MPAPHIDENLLDQYAMGQLRSGSVEAIEEHLLECRYCQERLMAADEFVGLFRAAAIQLDARPLPLWQRLHQVPALTWSAAVVMATVVTFVSLEFRKPPVVPETVLMQAFRGPEAATAVRASKPVRLVFDLRLPGDSRDYEFEIVNLLGTRVMGSQVEFTHGRLTVLVEKLEAGSYWARIYRKVGRELIAEYGLRSE